jgi:hypothetical protein
MGSLPDCRDLDRDQAMNFFIELFEFGVYLFPNRTKPPTR